MNLMTETDDTSAEYARLRLKRRIASVIVALALLAALRMTVAKRFDSEAWVRFGANRDWDEMAGRQAMFLDLYLFRRTIGLTREEAVALLGPPDPSAAAGGATLAYDMGRAPSSLDHAWLELHFEDGVVASCSWRKR